MAQRQISAVRQKLFSCRYVIERKRKIQIWSDELETTFLNDLRVIVNKRQASSIIWPSLKISIIKSISLTSYYHITLTLIPRVQIALSLFGFGDCNWNPNEEELKELLYTSPTITAIVVSIHRLHSWHTHHCHDIGLLHVWLRQLFDLSFSLAQLRANSTASLVNLIKYKPF